MDHYHRYKKLSEAKSLANRSSEDLRAILGSGTQNKGGEHNGLGKRKNGGDRDNGEEDGEKEAKRARKAAKKAKKKEKKKSEEATA